jgi:hypothetical protein
MSMKRANPPPLPTKDTTTINLEGYVVGLSSISKNENNSNLHYSLTMEVRDGGVITVVRYLSPTAVCRLHAQLRSLSINQNGFELSNVKTTGSSYTITNETKLIEKDLSFEPEYCVIQDIHCLKILAQERICSIECKILHIGPPQQFTITSGFKRTQKLRKEVVVADQTSAILLNLYEQHFDSIQSNLSYKITAVKTRLYNDIISLTTIGETK